MQRCYSPLIDDHENVNAVREDTILGSGPTIDHVKAEQNDEFGDVSTYSDGNDNMVIDEDGILRDARYGHLAVVMPKILREEVLRHVHGSSLTGHYRRRRTVA